MNYKPNFQEAQSFKALRAIASRLVKRYIFWISLVFFIVLLIIFIISIILAIDFSNWWLLLTLFCIFPLLISLVAASLAYFVSRIMQPRQLSKLEKKKINAFIDEFGIKYAAAKGVKKTPTGLALVIFWKYLRGQGNKSFKNVLIEPIDDARDMKLKFKEISEFFSN